VTEISGLDADHAAQAMRGLSSAEAAARRARVGPNKVSKARDEPLWKELLESLVEPLQLLLLVVGVLYAVLGQLRDALIIFGVILTVAAVETWTEHRAGRAIAALSRLAAPRALAWRDGRLVGLPPEDLVPDDVILLSAGSRVPADARLLEAEELLVDESLVTGESQPVERSPAGAEQGDLNSGTYVVRGRGVARVTAVGAASSLGRIAALVKEAKPPRTPLQNQIAELARGLLVAALAVSVIVPLIGVLRGQPWREMLLTGLTLAFATIPEELPILVVIVLGLGSLRLARRGAIVRRLVAAETLGATTLVCTDKTGTLTENRMTLTATVTAAGALGEPSPDGATADRVRRFAAFASEPPAGDTSALLDPMDVALWRSSDETWPQATVRFSFDGVRRLASGLVPVNGGVELGAKGAPEAILERATSWRGSVVHPLDEAARRRALEAAAVLAADGGRVLAVASRHENVPPGGDRDQFERDLVFEGLLVFTDPLRPEVPAAVRDLRGAGVSITVITGDQAPTAAAVARSAGLDVPVLTAADTANWSDRELAAAASRGCVVARALPGDKLRIVRAATDAGQVVAVTGDGVNDAPALAAAAIGVAMGRGGSDVAREAADVVLTDDNFATLAAATSEGRRLYENLRKAIRYYLAIKLALITVSLVAALSGLPLPFAPVQIVILELFMDLGASVAFVHQPAESDEMRRPPRDPRARFLDRSMLVGIAQGGLTLAVLSGGVFLVSLSAMGVDSARTLALVAWLIGHAVLGIIMGWERRPVPPADLLRNPAMLAWVGASALFALLLLTVPAFGALLHAGPVGLAPALATVLAAVVFPLWLEVAKRVRRS
jgi:P-type Ca2+ transporter type 2C